MTFKEYTSEHADKKEIKLLEKGSVLVDKDDVFKEIHKTKRHPVTDEKYNQLYVILKINEKLYTYKVGMNKILITPFSTSSVFKLNY